MSTIVKQRHLKPSWYLFPKYKSCECFGQGVNRGFICDGDISKGLSILLLCSFPPSVLAGQDPSWGDVVSLYGLWSKMDAAEASPGPSLLAVQSLCL